MSLFLDRLKQNARLSPKKTLFRWLENGKETVEYTYEEFDCATDTLAARLLSPSGLGVSAKDEAVMLVYPPGLDFIIAFVACLKAGVLPVPVYPPRPGFKKDLHMFINVQSDCRATVALTSSTYNYAKKVESLKSLLTMSHARWPSMKWHVFEAPAKIVSKCDVAQSFPSADSLAFIQYTSGSTSKPKGVMISHGNLAHNLSAIISALEANGNTSVVSWLPCYHDMGLIGSLLGVAYCGGSGVYMSPLEFIRKPLNWLTAVSKYRATHIQAPNFAYKYVVRKYKEFLKNSGSEDMQIDLSSLKHMFNAAEPIEIDALDDFLNTFNPFGLNREAMSPGYGLAEHTVYVCDQGRQRILVDKDALENTRKVIVKDRNYISDNIACGDVLGFRWIMGCGNPHRNLESGIKVRIVDDETRMVLPDDTVGEVWVDSLSKAQGYFGLPEKSAEVFSASIIDSEADKFANGGRNQWLRTGDLGFFHNNELFICGRMKDLIIIRGRNHFPQDIENSVEHADNRIRQGCIAAFSLSDEFGNGENLGIVAEVRPEQTSKTDLEEISEKVRKKVLADHGLFPMVLVLISKHAIPKTTSGKISRHRARLAVQKSELTALHTFKSLSNPDSLKTSEDVLEYAELSIEEDETTNSYERQNSSRSALVRIEESSVQKPLDGESLIQALQEEVARLIENDPSEVSTNAAVSHLGMDSLSLVQFKGVIESTYGTDIPDLELFDESTTLETIRDRIQGKPISTKFVEENHGQLRETAPTTASVKTRKKPSSVLSCFGLCCV